jgi:hypothetical protein
MEKRRILLATGSDQLDQILSTSVLHDTNKWEIAKSVIDIRKHIVEKTLTENPDILIVHDMLMSEFESKIDKDNEWVSIFQQVRIEAPQVRIVFIGLRNDKDPFLLNIINLGVFDLFITEKFAADIFLAQLEKPANLGNVMHIKNKTVSHIKHDSDPGQIAKEQQVVLQDLPKQTSDSYSPAQEAAEEGGKGEFLPINTHEEEQMDTEEEDAESVGEQVAVIEEQETRSTKDSTVKDFSLNLIQMGRKVISKPERAPVERKVERKNKTDVLLNQDTFLVSVVSPFPAGKTFLIRHLLELLPREVTVVDRAGELTHFDLVQQVTTDWPDKLQPITLVETRGDREIIERSNLIIFVHTPFGHHQRKSREMLKACAKTGNQVISVLNLWDPNIPVSPNEFVGSTVLLTLPYYSDWLLKSWNGEALPIPELQTITHKIKQKNQLVPDKEAAYEWA